MRRRSTTLCRAKYLTVPQTSRPRGWRAVLTEAGRFYPGQGRHPEPQPEPAESIGSPEGTGERRRAGRPRNAPDQPGSVLDLATIHSIVKDDPRFNVPATVAKRLRLKTNVSHVQAGGRGALRGEDHAGAGRDPPRDGNRSEGSLGEDTRATGEVYGFYANFETVGSQIEVAQKEENHVIKPVELDREGPMLISLAMLREPLASATPNWVTLPARAASNTFESARNDT